MSLPASFSVKFLSPRQVSRSNGHTLPHFFDHCTILNRFVVKLGVSLTVDLAGEKNARNHEFNRRH